MGVKEILKKFNEIGQCEKSYQQKGFCHSYFFEHFNAYPSVLRINNDYLKTIKEKNFHDPILTYVALYLYHNYKIAQQYFKPRGDNEFINKSYGESYNTACAVLNRWLDQQKNFYTHFGTCFYNLRWWNISIEPLWDKLETYYDDKKCERYNSYYYKEEYLNKSINSALNVTIQKDICYQQQPEDNVCFKKKDTDINSIKENCVKLSILFYLCEKYKLLDQPSGETNTTTNNYRPQQGNSEQIYYNSMLKAEKLCFCDSLISTIALPICVTVLGTLVLAFFLNEFTPLGSKLQIRSKNKFRLSDQLNEEAAYNEYKTYRNNNQNTAREKNIIYYKYMNE